LTSVGHRLSGTGLVIDDTPALSPTEVRARVRRLKREQDDLALIVIDYLQLMQAPESGEHRVAEISAISRPLKSLARELDIPVIALSQLNRSLEQRPNKRPIMSDLRESGAIEQDADLIAFIYRDKVYNEDSPDKGIADNHHRQTAQRSHRDHAADLSQPIHQVRGLYLRPAFGPRLLRTARAAPRIEFFTVPG